jgi:hypothetical protein
MTMLRRGMFVVCVLAAACGKGKERSGGGGSGSASPPPAIDAMAAPMIDAPGAPAIDAASPSPADTFTITKDGVGPIVGFKGVASDDQASIAELQKLLAGTGLDVRFEVMDIGEGEDEAEEGYYSIRQGDAEVAQVMRTEPVMTVHVTSPRFATTDGVRVGDTLPDLTAKRNALACQVRTGEPLGLITCRSPGEPDVVFVLDAACWKGKPPPAGKPVDPMKLGPCKIVEIVR